MRLTKITDGGQIQKLEPLTLAVKGWLCCVCCHGYGPLDSLEGQVTANQYQVVPSDHLKTYI